MRTVLAAVVLVAAAALPAAAEPAPPTGPPCSYDAVHWEPLGDGVWNGELHGGPLVAAGGEPVTVTCAIHVNGGQHSDPAAVSVTGPTLPGLGVVAPTAVSFRATETDVVDLCTSAKVGATTWYWDGLGWSTDSGAPCSLAYDSWPVSGLSPDEQALVWAALCPVRALLSPWYVDCVAEIDRALCPQLRKLSPGVPGVVTVNEQGDVYVAGEPQWDCPPYDIWPPS